ncbi:zinc finger (C3HC4-type RING finger) family protein [Euphorbia peplus]|nr:zinc finger (C3HC4-type RING finger) family protein [Euphorbia peplus]
MVDGELIRSPMANPESLISPRFKSLAAMAGWDEESILIASLIVEDTPDRDSKIKKRSCLNLKSPPSNPSIRKRRNQIKISVPFINLDEEKPETQQHEENEKAKKETEAIEECQKQDSCSKSVPPPCMDKLKEELSCAICLEICFEPSTTSCGHSFCKKCLRSAADKCGRRCPKCRELISNGRSCTVNTVLWNTIQLLFPEEVEARKASNNRREDPSREVVEQGGPRRKRPAYSPRAEVEQLSRLLNGRNRGGGTSRQSEQAERSMQRENLSWVLDERGRRRERPNQDEDAALALRLQRQEFMGAFSLGTSSSSSSSSLSLARANLRAMASRANYNMRTRRFS